MKKYRMLGCAGYYRLQVKPKFFSGWKDCDFQGEQYIASTRRGHIEDTNWSVVGKHLDVLRDEEKRLSGEWEEVWPQNGKVISKGGCL